MNTTEKAKELSDFLYFKLNHIDYDTLNKKIIEMAEWKEQQMIEKAVKWLEENADFYTWYNEFEGESGMIDEFIEDFKKAMKKD